MFLVKFCKSHPDFRCYHDSCTFLDSMGNVHVCGLVFDKGALFMRKKVVCVSRPLFSKHLKGGRP